MTEHHYPAMVGWSPEDGCFIAIAPDLPGCCAAGHSAAKAIEELQDAMTAWLAAQAAAGNPQPSISIFRFYGAWQAVTKGKLP